MSAHKKTELRRAAAHALKATGMKQVEIALALGVSQCVVSVYLRNGAPIPRREKDERAERMESLYRSGLTLEEVSLQFNLTRERVRQILKKRGIGRNQGGVTGRVINKPINVGAAKIAR